MPKGFLPVFSVNTEDEAKRLIVATCSRGTDGQYYSAELAMEQTIAMLEQFSRKLERVYSMHCDNIETRPATTPKAARTRR